MLLVILLIQQEIATDKKLRKVFGSEASLKEKNSNRNEAKERSSTTEVKFGRSLL